ncbi:DUF956 family protein [Leuconostoc citreum]
MVQSLNSKAELTTKGISYLGIGAQYGKFLIGDCAFEFFNDNNVSDFIQIPWANMTVVYASVSKNKIGRRFKIQTDKGVFDFSSPEAGKILKLIREHLGNDKVLKNPTLIKRLLRIFKKKHVKKGV